jgi:hypothetical protein
VSANDTRQVSHDDSRRIRKDESVLIDRAAADPVACFNYWHTCPRCGYNWITEDAAVCGKCARPITFYASREIKVGGVVKYGPEEPT